MNRVLTACSVAVLGVVLLAGVIAGALSFADSINATAPSSTTPATPTHAQVVELELPCCSGTDAGLITEPAPPAEVTP